MSSEGFFFYIYVSDVTCDFSRRSLISSSKLILWTVMHFPLVGAIPGYSLVPNNPVVISLGELCEPICEGSPKMSRFSSRYLSFIRGAKQTLPPSGSILNERADASRRG